MAPDLGRLVRELGKRAARSWLAAGFGPAGCGGDRPGRRRRGQAIRLTLAAGAATFACLSLARGALPADPVPGRLATNQPVRLELRWSYGGANLVTNGGFESGGFAGWTRSAFLGGWAINNGTLRPRTGEPLPTASGRYNAVAMPYSSSDAILSQTVTLPADPAAAVLSWSARSAFALSSTNALRPQFAVTCTASNYLVRTLFSLAAGDRLGYRWERYQADLLPFAGKTVVLSFLARGNGAAAEFHLDDVRLDVTARNQAAFEVYAGTNAVPAAGDSRGQTAQPRWPLDGLLPATTYYWQVVAREGQEAHAGPVWQFRTGPTGPADHLEVVLEDPAVPVNGLFAVTVTARDAAENAVPSYASPVRAAASAPGGAAPRLLISELLFASTDVIELQNVSGGTLDLPLLDLTFYDAARWPAPAATLTLTNVHLAYRQTLRVKEGAPVLNTPGLKTNLDWGRALRDRPGGRRAGP